MREIHHRLATPNDCTCLARLQAETFPDAPWGQDWFAQSLKSSHLHSFLQFDGHERTGFAVISRVERDAEILTLGILPTFQGQGLGRALLSYLLTEMKRENIKQIFLEVAANNAAAQALYQGGGFLPVGHRPNYYKTGQDALIFSCPL
ncbi:MAG: ribosomal protein S18-alanine N-acetyltransferase [bacterium]